MEFLRGTQANCEGTDAIIPDADLFAAQDQPLGECQLWMGNCRIWALQITDDTERQYANLLCNILAYPYDYCASTTNAT